MREFYPAGMDTVKKCNERKPYNGDDTGDDHTYQDLRKIPAEKPDSQNDQYNEKKLVFLIEFSHVDELLLQTYDKNQ